MDPPANDGPDGSSIRPVSSLLAKFENLNKNGDVPTGASSRTASPAPPAPVPAPKPGRLRERESSPSGTREAPPVPPARPSGRLNVSNLNTPAAHTSPSTSPTRSLPPPISPRLVHPPSLLVDPPQSPPKRGMGGVPTGDRPAFVNTDSLVKSSSPVPATKQYKIPARPHTPVLEPRRSSPRLAPSQPPSPPPPRRSAELRRERDTKEGSKPVPPPINRAEKPLIGAARFSLFAQPSQPTDLQNRANDKISPFNSPPSSSGTAEEDTPPMLPTRPKTHPERAPRSKAFQVAGEPLEPPPIHPSIASRRMDRDGANGTGGELLSPQAASEQPPALPARPLSIVDPGRATNAISAPPPRPSRPGVNTHHSEIGAAAAVTQKRVASTPTTQIPPTIPRLNGRSMTMGVERVPGRTATDFRPPPAAPATPIEPRSFDSQIGSSARGEASAPVTTAYPDTSRTNRSKPYIGRGVHEIATNYDSRAFDVCGALVCTTGSYTRAWSVQDGELLMSLAMGEGLKGTAVMFKPGANVDEEGQRVWIGNNYGEILEADIYSQTITNNRPGAHGRYEIIKMYRHFNELWTLDESGTLHVWGPDEKGVPNLSLGPTQSYRVPKGHMFSMVVGDELWHATGKDIRVFLPSLDGRVQFQVLIRPLTQDSAGEVTAGTILPSDRDKVYFGHSDGKVSIYSRKDYSCLGVMNISQYKISSLAGAGQYMWAGYNTGKMSVYDMRQTPWALKKDWQAHKNPVLKLVADQSSFYKLDRCQVVSLGADNMLRAWDGLLQEDWLEGEMKRKDTEYCSFEKIKALVLTWNAGASTPHSLRYSEADATFIQNLLQSSDSPDIIVFGFQELVDLEDKTATAKRFLKPKKKEGSDQERMSHQYRDWRNFLAQSLDDYMAGGGLYHILHTAPLVGLFTCIFVKADLRERVSNLSSAEVKRGMGGLHGNKGAIVVRFMVDDTSLCFINCHLAAGQTSANQRHNDIAAILEASLLPAERDPAARVDCYVGGGDGTMILDHELCLLNGDLNYRIDTMSRDTVVAAVKAGNLGKLLERDQLLVARRRNPAFRLRAFDELPIAFAPTYKYDVGTDNYDTSEKRRSPAWCDRLLYRCGSGRGRIEQLDYRRHEVRVSDHRPVSGRFRFHVKRIDPKRRAVAWMECQQRWEDLRAKEVTDGKLFYLTKIIGYDKTVAQQLINERSTRRDHRSPSRHRE
ncbi:Type I inositol polyphosphate 5-phosphatase 8 [Madurella mycetomatis]|uniref:Type I inositol polyphosphate 5-phosphatase 8 n=1 Tax=Madurella mycetomatis TaxID=100816 RepID=A0A175VTV3_9PEZI|nr:Type I inositol polyphosphate 5-phosphatase 8 [Madurella mycetomatis]